jgi:hypothetical protein
VETSQHDITVLPPQAQRPEPFADLVLDAPILSAMLADWQGPAASLMGLHFARLQTVLADEVQDGELLDGELQDDDEATGGKPKRSGERPPKPRRTTPRLRHPSRAA